MRDQRMLQCLETLPRRTKVVLRNGLTRRYPAVPLPSTVTQNKFDDNEKETGGVKTRQFLADYDMLDIGDNLTYIGMKQRGIIIIGTE